MTPSKFQREVMRFLRDIGATDVCIEPGGVHPRIVFSIFGKEWDEVLSSSPSDVNASKSAIRKLAHRLGLVKHGKTVGKRRARRIRAQERHSPCPRISTLPDYRPDLLRCLSPEELNAVADLAGLDYWRSAMRAVGAESRL